MQPQACFDNEKFPNRLLNTGNHLLKERDQKIIYLNSLLLVGQKSVIKACYTCLVLQPFDLVLENQFKIDYKQVWGLFVIVGGKTFHKTQQ